MALGRRFERAGEDQTARLAHGSEDTAHKSVLHAACSGKRCLTRYDIMMHFGALKICSCGKHCEKSRNYLLQAISPLLAMFFTLYGTHFFYFKCTLKFTLKCPLCGNGLILILPWVQTKICLNKCVV